MWHLLQLSDTIDAEFGSALGERVPLTAWEPARTWIPPFRYPAHPATREIPDPPLSVRSFPLLHGFASWPGSLIARTGPAITQTLLAQTPDPAASPLICTVPYFAPVAERWPGPVVYWLTDRIERYQGVNIRNVHALDRRMCGAATLVCPNSARLAEYLLQDGRCSSNKIQVIPNATRESNLLAEPPSEPALLPEDIRTVRRPVAGVIGNLAGNMDWLLLLKMMQATPDFTWVFVGPTTMPIGHPMHREARRKAMLQPNACFLGRKAYGDLAAYARSFDVALLPYLRGEPTYSGSSTRFYEHLAACRPMLATHGFEELLHKEPLLTLFSEAEQGVRLLEGLRVKGFDDGLSGDRWRASLGETWQARAARVVAELSAITG